jgi:cytochrome c553
MLLFSESLFNKVRKMAKSSLISAALLFAAAATAHAAGDSAAGARKIFQCQGCHGIPGVRTAFPELYSVPRLGGQHPAYIVQALQGYKKGDRSHPTMRAVAADLSDQDMADIAAYYGAAAK